MLLTWPDQELTVKISSPTLPSGDHVARIEKLEQLNASAPATHIGDNLKKCLPIRPRYQLALWCCSAMSRQHRGIDLETISEIKRQRIPIHTVGFGREQMAHDIEVTDAQLPVRSLAKSRLQAVSRFISMASRRQSPAGGARERKGPGESRHCLEERWRRPDRNRTVQCRRRGREEFGIYIGRDAIRGQQEQQQPDSGFKRRQRQAAHSLLEGEPTWTTSSAPRRRRRQEHRAREHCPYYAEQDLSAGIANKDELKDGFPTKVEEMFAFQGMIIGSVEANYFTTSQQELMQQFVDRAAADCSSWAGATRWPMALRQAALLGSPSRTSAESQEHFHREPATPQLTPAGRDSLITRIDENPEANFNRWKKLPYLMNFQEAASLNRARCAGRDDGSR